MVSGADAMTLKTSIIIDGNSSGGVKAVDELIVRLDTAQKTASGASAALGSLEGAQTGAAGAARDSAGAVEEQAAALTRAGDAARDLSSAVDGGKVAAAAAAGAAREATGAQQAYAQAMADAAENGRKLSAANDDVSGGIGDVSEKLADMQKAQTSAATGASDHASAIEGLQSEIKDIVAQVTSGTPVFEAMATRGDAVAEALQKVADSSRGATKDVADTGGASKAASEDVGALTDKVQDVAEGVADAGGKFSAMAGIIAGPVGAAIGFALSIGAELLAQYIAMGSEIDDEIDRLKQSAHQTAIAAEAHEAFARTQEGLRASVRSLTEELDRQNDALKTNAERQNISAKIKLANLQADPDGHRAELRQAREDLALARATAGGDPTGGQIVIDAMRRVSAAQSAVDQLNADIKKASEAVEKSHLALAQENAKAATDAVARINKEFDLKVQKLTDFTNREIAAGKKVGKATQDRFDEIEAARARKLAEQAERDRASPRTARPVSIGNQIEATQASELYAIAQRYNGLSENRGADRNVLKDLFAQAKGQPIDPRITAWCAAFVNAVLATDGIKGTGSLAARSFLDYGEATDKPNKGDIVVSRRGDNAAQGHVGFYAGTDAKGRVLVLGGNTRDQVGTMPVDRADVLGFRKAPTASSQYSAEQKAAADAQKQLAQDIAQVTAKYLPAKQAAKEYADELERIERLAKGYDPNKPGSGLSPEDVAKAKAAAAAARDKRLADLAMTPEIKAGEDAKKSIDGVIASLQQEMAVRQAMSPVDAAMIQHRKELADLARVDPAAAAAREQDLRDTYAQVEATRAVDDATREAAQAQAQLRNIALDALDAIIVGGRNAGDVIKRLAQTIASAALEASLFGTGPLAALMNGKVPVPAYPNGIGDGAAGRSGTQSTADILGGTISKSIGDRLDKLFGNAGGGKALQYAGYGYMAGSLTGGSGVGGSIGGLLGGEIAKKTLTEALGKLGGFAGPLGSIAGGILGGIVGKLFSKPTTGAAVITSASAPAALSGKVGEQLGGTASGVQSSLQQIAEQLGGELGAFSVAIGKRNDYFRVSASGNAANTTSKHYGSDIIYDGKDEAAAVAAALRNAIQDGAVKGLSAAVQRALQSSSDVEASLKEALKVQDVELMVGGIGAEIDKAFKDFERTAAERVRIAQQYGFDVVAIEKRNAADRLKLSDELLKKQVGGLQQLIDEMTQGSLFEGTALDKITALNEAIAKAKADVDAGVDGAVDTLANLYAQRLAAAKDAYGTTSGYADARTATLDEARAAVAAANARINAANGAKTGSDPALATTNAALDENNDQNAQMLAALNSTNELLGQIAADNNQYGGKFFDIRKLASA